MKKILILMIILLTLTGCLNIQRASIDDIINEIQNSNLSLSNQSRNGYKYHLPLTMQTHRIDGPNEILVSKGYKYFFHVDFVSQFHKTPFQYQISDSSYISKDISLNDIPGYLEVNVKNDKYLIEIMYNYAKIEVIVDENYLNEAIANAFIVLSTIKFNEIIVQNMMSDEGNLTFGEEQINIFDTNRGESNFLRYEEEYGQYDGDDIPDLDRIN